MKHLLVILGILIVSTALYSVTIRGVSGNPQPADFKEQLDTATMPFELSPERGRFVHVYALAEHGTYQLDEALGEIAYPDVGAVHGKIYSFFAPGTAYFASPFYILGKTYGLAQVFTFAAIALASIISLIFIYLIGVGMLRLSIPAALFAVVLFAFGSTAWSYATTLYQHHLTVLCITSGVYAAWRFSTATHFSFFWAFWVGAAYAFAVTVDYPNVLLALPMVLFLLVSAVRTERNEQGIGIFLRWSVFGALLSFVLITGAHLYHNAYYFDDWKQTAGGLSSYTPASYATTTTLVKTVTPLKEKNIVSFFHEEKIPQGIDVLLFSIDRGLFLYWPIAILSILGAVVCIRRRENGIWVLLSLIGVTLFLYASWGDPWGGWAYGPRYLIVMLPWLALFVAVALTHGTHLILKKLLASVLFAYGVAVAVLGVLTSNAVPPRIEALQLPVQTYGYSHNLRLLAEGDSSSYIYRTFLTQYISLDTFYGILFSVVLVLGLALLWSIKQRNYD